MPNHVAHSNSNAKNRAHQAVQRAIKSGALVRPESCDNCGAHPGCTTDGRPLIHAHHDDYSASLSAKWLCASCHRQQHLLTGDLNSARRRPECLARGEKNGRSKITAEQAQAIKGSTLSSRKLAAMHGIGATTVLEIKKGKIWKSL